MNGKAIFNYPAWFIGWALLCLLSGISLGIWFMTPMGGDLSLLVSHVHVNLFGWVTLTLYGLIHNGFPDLAHRRLARCQFVCAVLGGICLPLGFGLSRELPFHKLVIGLGAASGAIAALLFAVMFAGLLNDRNPTLIKTGTPR